MRRLIAYIVLIVSMLALVFFNVQGGVESFNWSQEFDKGTEVVYNIVPNSENGVDIENVIETMGNRLEEAGATNYTLESAINEAENEYEVRIVLGSRNTANIDNILRSTSTSGEFSLSTTDGMNALEDVIKRGTAEVKYHETSHEAYVRVETTKDVETLITKAKEDVGDSLLVLWQNKTEDFDYSDLQDSDYVCSANNLTASQLKNRVVAVVDFSEQVAEEGAEPVIDLSNWSEGVDTEEGKYYLTFKAFGYAENAESSQVMNSESAHSIARILNSDVLEYDINEVYRISAAQGYGSLAKTLIIVAMAALIVIVCVSLLVAFKLNALSGVAGILLTVLAEIGFINFFGLTVTPVVILSVLVNLAASTTFLCVYYNKTKEEAYRGRALSKASNDAFRKSIPVAIDITIVTFVLGVVLALISREAIKVFSLFFIFSSLISVLLVVILSKLLNNFIYDSNVASNLKLFKLNPDHIADLDGNVKVEEKNAGKAIVENGVKKSGKKVSIASLILVAVSVASIVGFGIAGSSFNYSNANEFSRIEVRSAETRIFEKGNDSNIEFTTEKSALDNLVYYLENVNADDGVKVSRAWTVTDQVNPYETEKNYIYFYVDLESTLAVDSTTFTKLEAYVVSIDDNELTTLVNVYNVESGVVTNDFLNTVVLMAVTVGITLVYFLIRYRYTFALSSVANLVIGTTITIGLLSLTRLETSAYAGVGILAGLLINALLLMPLGNKMNQLKNESKVKITVFEQREEIAYNALASTVKTHLVAAVVAVGVLVALIAISPIKMYSIYLAAIISIVVNAALAIFANVPMHLAFEKTFKFKRLKSARAEARKAKREKIQKENRSKGAEPEEIIIPGIND